MIILSVQQHLLGAVPDDGHGDSEQMGNQEEQTVKSSFNYNFHTLIYISVCDF